MCGPPRDRRDQGRAAGNEMTLYQADPGPAAYNALGLAGFVTSLVGVLGYIPIAVAVFAGLAGGVSYTLTIIRDPTIQMWVARHRQKRQAAKIKRLKAKQLIVNARIEALERMNQVKAEITSQVEEAKKVAADVLKKT